MTTFFSKTDFASKILTLYRNFEIPQIFCTICTVWYFFGLDTSTSDKQLVPNVKSPKKTQLREIFAKKKRLYFRGVSTPNKAKTETQKKDTILF